MPLTADTTQDGVPSRAWSPTTVAIGVVSASAVQPPLLRAICDDSAVSGALSLQPRATGDQWWWLSLAALVVAVVPALAYANAILNHFYLQGAYFWDSGVVAGAIWRRDVWLTYPPLWPIGSLYAYHVHAIAVGAHLGEPRRAVRFAGMVCLGDRRGARTALRRGVLATRGRAWASFEGQLAAAVALAIMTAFTGIPLATILFPHPRYYLRED